MYGFSDVINFGSTLAFSHTRIDNFICFSRNNCNCYLQCIPAKTASYISPATFAIFDNKSFVSIF